jgi:hypothetical protein
LSIDVLLGFRWHAASTVLPSHYRAAVLPCCRCCRYCRCYRAPCAVLYRAAVLPCYCRATGTAVLPCYRAVLLPCAVLRATIATHFRCTQGAGILSPLWIVWLTTDWLSWMAYGFLRLFCWIMGGTIVNCLDCMDARRFLRCSCRCNNVLWVLWLAYGLAWLWCCALYGAVTVRLLWINRLARRCFRRYFAVAMGAFARFFMGRLGAFMDRCR